MSLGNRLEKLEKALAPEEDNSILVGYYDREQPGVITIHQPDGSQTTMTKTAWDGLPGQHIVVKYDDDSGSSGDELDLSNG